MIARHSNEAGSSDVRVKVESTEPGAEQLLVGGVKMTDV